MNQFFTFGTLFLLFSIFNSESFAGLMDQRIWKMSDHKRAVYLDTGIFHSGNGVDSAAKIENELKHMRNSYDAARGYERLVFELSGSVLPFVYGQVSAEGSSLTLDIRGAVLKKDFKPLKRTQYISQIDLYHFGDDFLSTELRFNGDLSFDIFYLESPTRIVIDIKK